MFSSAIKISSVSDYITPSQECIKPLLDRQKIVSDLTEDVIQKPDLIKFNNSKDAARVSLQDCLACSGCVTTAETILIESHSINEFLTRSKNSEITVVGISPQSRASIAADFNLSVELTHQIIEKFLKNIDQKIYLLDMQDFIQVSLENSQKEFIDRLNQNSKIPLLCSECPGWVCYAEKTLDSWILSHMSQVKSPQQLFGIFSKNFYQSQNTYTVTIMPCYDKKLEAVRIQNANEIDTVISTNELSEFIKKDEQFIKSISNAGFIQQNIPITKGLTNSTSNGYLDHIIEEYIKYIKLENYEIIQQQKKNSDFIEILVKKEQQTIASFARVYGLKNIANLTASIKNGNCKYLYVEIMACPSGCLNGGGQVKVSKDRKQTQNVEILKQFITFVKNQDILAINQIRDKIGDRVLTTFQTVPKLIAKLEW